jgi:hypothetical protein
MLNIRSLALSALFTCALAGTAVSQQLWEKAPEKWNKEDVLRITSSSPWAVTHQSTEAQARASMVDMARGSRNTVNSGGNGATAGSANRDAGPAPVVFRLHSAEPIRRAITRGRQIAAGYDKMDDAGKQQFDKANKSFLECGICKDYYVISATKYPDTTSQYVDEAIFQRMSLADLKGNVWLINDKGEKREIFQFTAPKKPGESAYLFFARKADDGNPLISFTNRSFSLVFNNGFFSPSNPYASFVPRSVEFSVAKITLDERLAF